MKKTIGFIVFLFLIMSLVSCLNLTARHCDGYTLEKVDDGYAIAELSEEAKEKDEYTIPNKIGVYKIVEFGSKKTHMMGAELYNLSFGNIRKINIPDGIRIKTTISGPKLIETDCPISKIEGLIDNTNERHYFLSPKEDLDVNYVDDTCCKDGLIFEDKDDEKIKISYSYANNIEIPEAINEKIVDEIGEYAFEGAYNITVSNKIRVINEGAFSKTNDILIPDDNDIVEIHNNAFLYSNISNFNFKKCEIIGSGAFKCTKLENLVLPDTLKHLGSGAFFDISTLKNVIMLDSEVVEIPRFCFHLSDLSGEIKLSNNITTICEAAFLQCNLKRITLPKSVKKIETDAFTYNWFLEEITLPDDYVYVEADFIGKCNSLTTLNLGGASNFIIEDSSIAELNSLKTITVSEKNQYLYLKNGILYNIYDMIVRCPAQLDVKEIVINETPYNYAFLGNQFIEKATINSYQLSNGLFEDCISLKTVELNPIIRNIPFACFRGCKHLESINLDNIDTFGIQALYNTKFDTGD